MFNKLKQAIALAESKEFEVDSLDILIEDIDIDSDIEFFLKEDIDRIELTESELSELFGEEKKYELTDKEIMDAVEESIGEPTKKEMERDIEEDIELEDVLK